MKDNFRHFTHVFFVPNSPYIAYVKKLFFEAQKWTSLPSNEWSLAKNDIFERADFIICSKYLVCGSEIEISMYP